MVRTEAFAPSSVVWEVFEMRPARVDPSRCDACGLCERVCGRGYFTFPNGTIRYRPDEDCIACGHCMAVCPRGALLRADGTLPPAMEAESLPGAESLLRLFRARRSTRRFKEQVPSREVLGVLVEAARHAPTGTNKHAVSVVMVTDPDLLETLRRRIMARYGAYERHLSHPVKRFFLATFVDRRLGDPAIRRYLYRFMDTYRTGGDPLFHRAPAAAFLYAGGEASTPRDDCCIALYHMVLTAERIGLGSCLLGTVETAFAHTPRLNDLLGIPRALPVRAAACFGYPAVRFQREVDRAALPVKWL